MSDLTDVERLVALEEIRALPLQYARAIERGDAEVMIPLFVPHARFGEFGEGADGIHRIMADMMASNVLAVILVANHLVEFDSRDRAHGEVWAHVFSQERDEGFVEQLVKYEDRYERHDGRWCFLHRRHRLWYGVRHGDSPVDQEPANWPARQYGVGDLPLADKRFVSWWEPRRR